MTREPDPSADLVAGESRSVLREALTRLSTRRRADGGVEVNGELPAELGDPVERALGRLVEELRRHDERRGGPVRSERQLWPDAFMALVLRVADAGANPPGPAG